MRNCCFHYSVCRLITNLFPDCVKLVGCFASVFNFVSYNLCLVPSPRINSIQDSRVMSGGGEGAGGAKRLPTSFSSVTYAKVGISSKKVLTFRFNPFTPLV